MFRLSDLTRNWTLKLTALGLAVLLWSTVRADEEVTQVLTNVPVQVELRDPGWTVARPPAPRTVDVTFEGTYRTLLQLQGQDPLVILPIDQVEDSAGFHVISPRHVRATGDVAGVRAVDVRPSTVRLFFERLETELVPLAARTRGELPEGLVLDGPIRVEPGAIRVSGPLRRLDRIDSIPLEPIDLGRVVPPGSLRVAVDTAGLEQLLISPRTADVFLPLRRVIPDSVLLGEPGPDADADAGRPQPADTVAADTAAAGNGS